MPRKTKIIFIIVLVITTLFFSLFTTTKASQTPGTQWYYKDNFQTLSSPFNSFAECETALTAAKQAAVFGMNFEDCSPKTIVETPPVPVNAQTGTPTTDSSGGTYNLLAPLPGLNSVSNTGVCPSDPSASNGIGCYLNLIFKIGIGLCGALAVIMMIIGGVQWMGTESVFGKTEAKGRILSAILGLFIALGAFAILNTINPDLTGVNGVTVDQVMATIPGEDGL